MNTDRRWAPYAAGFLVCMLFVMLGLLVIQYPGAQYDEVLFVSAIHAPAEIECVLHTPFGRVPVMLMTYVGTLKAAIYAPLLLLAGSGHLTLRVPVLLCGAVSIWLFFLALRTLTNTPVAILGSLLLATDAIYLLTSVFDWGPVALQHLLSMAAFYAMVRFAQERRSVWLFAGALFAGLALWDKALFIWLLVGFCIALVVVYPRELWHNLRKPRVAITLLLGFALGSGPFLLYNITHGWSTFVANAQVETGGAKNKLRIMQRTLDGSGLMGYLVREDAEGPVQDPRAWERLPIAVNDALGDPRWSLQYFLLLAAMLVAPVLCWRIENRRICLLIALGGALASILMLSTAGAGGAIHHTILLWPLPHLLLGLALFAIFRQWPRILWKASMMVVLVCMVSNLLVLNMYLAHFIKSGPGLLWTDAVRILVGDLGRRQGRVVFAADWGILQQVEYYGAGRIGYHPGSDGVVVDLGADGGARMQRFLAMPNIVYVTHTEGHEAVPGVRKKLLAFAGQRGYTDNLLNVIKDRHGAAIFEIHEFVRR